MWRKWLPYCERWRDEWAFPRIFFPLAEVLKKSLKWSSWTATRGDPSSWRVSRTCIRWRFSAATVISTLCRESQGWNGDSVARALHRLL